MFSTCVSVSLTHTFQEMAEFNYLGPGTKRVVVMI